MQHDEPEKCVAGTALARLLAAAKAYREAVEGRGTGSSVGVPRVELLNAAQDPALDEAVRELREIAEQVRWSGDVPDRVAVLGGLADRIRAALGEL